jgi:hypothetical protein
VLQKTHPFSFSVISRACFTGSPSTKGTTGEDPEFHVTDSTTAEEEEERVAVRRA